MPDWFLTGEIGTMPPSEMAECIVRIQCIGVFGKWLIITAILGQGSA